jgi:signal peptidase I
MNTSFAENYVPPATPTPPTHTPTLPPSLPNGAQRRRDKEGFRNTLSTILILLLAPVVAVCLTLFVFQSYQVDGPSMEPTLQNSDRLIVLKLPKTWAKLTHHTYVPNRGDIIIFVENNLGALDQSTPKQLVKRVVGLPGDRVVVKDDKLTIFNKQHPNGFEPDVTLPYGKGVVASTSVTSCNSSSCDVTVPAGQVFVCGDNRANSLDSRVFGTVPTNDIVGKLVLRIFPLGTAERF